MKLALDPYMLRTTPLTELPGVVAELGYEWIELSPREDFTPFFLHPRAGRDSVRKFRSALDGAGVKIASHLPLYRWSGPDEDERQAAVRYADRLLTHVHVADSFDHRASSGLRYIVNPPGSTARIHQHLDIGQGEVDWDEFFGTLGELGFGHRDETIMTVCVFAWEERAAESSRANRERIEQATKSWT